MTQAEEYHLEPKRTKKDESEPSWTKVCKSPLPDVVSLQM